MSLPLPPHEKILTRAELVERYGRPRKGRLVFTNGCFDLLHRGHVEYLFAARALGDQLVLGLNSDDSVRRLKGPERPIVNEEDRTLVIAALAAVDAVTIFDELTPAKLIETLSPDILVKGGDYRPEEVVGRESVEEAGGKVVIIPFVEGQSTTSIIERLQKGQRRI